MVRLALAGDVGLLVLAIVLLVLAAALAFGPVSPRGTRTDNGDGLRCNDFGNKPAASGTESGTVCRDSRRRKAWTAPRTPV